MDKFSTQRREGAEGEISEIPPEGGTPNAGSAEGVSGDWMGGGRAGPETGGPSKEEELLEEPPEGGTPNAWSAEGVSGDWMGGGRAGAETGVPSEEEELLEEPPEGVTTNWEEESLESG